MKKLSLIILALWAASLGVPAAGLTYSDVLDTTEEQAMAETLQHTLEYNTNGQESYWSNPDTGRSGSVVPVNRFVDAKGLTCREYISIFAFDGEEQRGYGTACRKADGEWMVVLDQGATGYAEVVSGPRYVYVYRDPYRTYYPWVYYAPYHYPHRIYFSFVFSSHSGYFQHKYFHSGNRFYKEKPTHYRTRTTYDDRYHHGERRILHGTRSFRHRDDRRAIPLRDRVDDRIETHKERDYRSGHEDGRRGKGYAYDVRGGHDYDHGKDGHDGLKNRHDRNGHDRMSGHQMGEMKPGKVGKRPEVNNIHRDQGVDVWAPIRSDWGYKGNHKGLSERPRGRPPRKRVRL